MHLIHKHPCFFLFWIRKLNFSGRDRVGSCARAGTRQGLALQHPLLETSAAFPSEQRQHMIDIIYIPHIIPHIYLKSEPS